MKLENENELVQEEITEQAEGVIHKRVDEQEPEAPEEAVLPTDEEPEDEILDLFGEPVAPKPVKLAPAKPAAAPAKKKEPAKPKEDKKYGPEYQYAYAGHVGNLPEEDMVLERVREYMQIDFPELSKERTRMEVDEERKLIIPIVKGTKSG